MTELHELPPEHELRNAPLIRIGAQQKLHANQRWLPLGPTFRIATCSYNDLGPAWTATAVWRANPATP